MAASDLTTPWPVALSTFLSHLSGERRLSPRTLDAYQRDLGGFGDFLLDHLGAAPDLSDLATLSPRDFRAFMAARRRDGLSPRSLARALSAIRRFAALAEGMGIPPLTAVATAAVSSTWLF